ncbi:hypothetical protein MMC18_006835 [Xylographa bjoerkii]|nr:hypothetical protein [Xylographa bjoerkii]
MPQLSYEETNESLRLTPDMAGSTFMLSPLCHESSANPLWNDHAITDFTIKNVTKSRKPSPSDLEYKSRAPTYIFLDQTNKASGKIDSPAARKTIRSHVMLQVQKKRAQLLKEPRGIAASRDVGTQSIVSDHSNWELSKTPPEHSESPKSAVHSYQIQRNPVESLCRPFYRATDTFAYAGGSVIDIKSYRFFNHYSWEFHTILCDGIQPISSASSNLCCSAAVQENSSPLLHAICFFAAAHEAAAQDEQSSPRDLLNASSISSPTQQNALYYKSVTLKLLGEEFSKTLRITEATILCVALLLAAEAIIGDPTGLAVHTKGLIHIVKLFGGFDLLSPRVAAQVSFADIKAAIAQQRPPSFSPRFSLRHPPSSFQAQPLLVHLSPLIQHYLLLTQHLTLATHHSTSHISTPPFTLSDFLSLEHALLSLPSSHLLSGLDNAVRIALLLYANTALWTPPLYFTWVLALLAQLKAAMLTREMHRVEVPHCEELLLWMAFLGGYVASATSGVEAVWWAVRLRDAAVHLGVGSWEQARGVVGGVLYVEEVYGAAWEEFWHYAVGGASAAPEGALRLRGPHPCKHNE